MTRLAGLLRFSARRGWPTRKADARPAADDVANRPAAPIQCGLWATVTWVLAEVYRTVATPDSGAGESRSAAVQHAIAAV
jgi:hypothetical protein